MHIGIRPDYCIALRMIALQEQRRRAQDVIDAIFNEQMEAAMKGKGSKKVEKVMHEFKSGALHSGSKSGPEVTNRRQAIAIGLSEARKAGASIPKKK